MVQLGSDSNWQTCLSVPLKSYWNREITHRLNLITDLTMVWALERNICSTYSRELCFKQSHLPTRSFVSFIEWNWGRWDFVLLMHVTFRCLWHFYYVLWNIGSRILRGLSKWIIAHQEMLCLLQVYGRKNILKMVLNERMQKYTWDVQKHLFSFCIW